MISGASGLLTWNGAAHQLKLEIGLDLNPQRFLAHQEEPTISAIAAKTPADTLRLRPEVAVDLASHSLDGNSNLLVGTTKLGSTSFESREANWTLLLRAYLDHVLTLVRANLDKPDVTGLDVRWQSIREAKICWELQHREALPWLSDFRRAVFFATSDAVWRRRIRFLESGGERNADWVVIPLTQAIKLKLYAKTLDRVRVEVAYRGASRITGEVQRAGWVHSDDDDDVLTKLVWLPRRASERVQFAWENIMGYAGTSTAFAN